MNLKTVSNAELLRELARRENLKLPISPRGPTKEELADEKFRELESNGVFKELLKEYSNFKFKPLVINYKNLISFEVKFYIDGDVVVADYDSSKLTFKDKVLGEMFEDNYDYWLEIFGDGRQPAILQKQYDDYFKKCQDTFKLFTDKIKKLSKETGISQGVIWGEVY